MSTISAHEQYIRDAVREHLMSSQRQVPGFDRLVDRRVLTSTSVTTEPETSPSFIERAWMHRQVLDALKSRRSGSSLIVAFSKG